MFAADDNKRRVGESQGIPAIVEATRRYLLEEGVCIASGAALNNVLCHFRTCVVCLHHVVCVAD